MDRIRLKVDRLAQFFRKANGRSMVAGAFAIAGPVFVSLTSLASPLDSTFEPVRSARRTFHLGLGFLRYQTDTNYDSGGYAYNPAKLRNNVRTSVLLPVSLGVWERVSLFGTLRWTSVGVEQVSGGDSLVGFSDQSFGLSNQTLGFSVLLKEWGKRNWALFQTHWDFPLYQNADAANEGRPFLGDGTTDVTGALFMNLTLAAGGSADLGLLLGSGYTWRSDEYSAHVPFRMGLAWMPVSSGLMASTGLKGFYSLQTDPNPVLEDRIPAGGSNYINAVNPSFASLHTEIGYQVRPGKLVSGLFDLPVWGRGTAKGTSFGLQLKWAFGGGAGTAASPSAAAVPPPSSKDQQPATGNPGQLGFTQYSMEARVVRMNDRLNLVQIDVGSDHGVSAGQVFDIFSVQKNGVVGDLVARARVRSVRADRAVLDITEYFREVWIEEGFLAKKLLEAQVGE